MSVVLQFLGTWYNFVYVLPLMICGIFILLQLSLGLLDHGSDHDTGHELEAGGHGGGDVHVDAHVEADVDAHIDAHVDAHVDAGFHAPTEVALAHSPHGETGVEQFHFAERLAGLLGVGKVPLTVLLETFGIMWGLIGILVNWGAFSLLSISSPAVLLASIPVALVGAVTSTRLIATGVERVIPATSTTSIKSHTLVGMVGTVTSARISTSSGEVKIAGVGSTPAWIAVRLAPECEGREIPCGSEVIVTHYDVASNHFLVAPAPPRDP